MKTAPAGRAAFTLIELLLSTALIALILGLLLSTADQTQKIAQRTTARVTTFQAARTGFEAMARTLSQATLNTYWQVDDPAVPKNFLRQSELHFLAGKTSAFFSNPALAGASGDVAKRYPTHSVFFQAPLGRTVFQSDLAADTALDPNLRKFRQLDDLLCACGYFIEWDDDRAVPAFLKATLPQRMRFRLMELTQAAEKLKLFDKTLPYNSVSPDSGATKYLSGRRPEWVTRALEKSAGGTFDHATVLAENVVALLLLPKLAEEDVPAAPNSGRLDPESSAALGFDSWAPAPGKTSGTPYHQLPPIVQVTMVAIDETSASQLAQRFPNSATLGLSMSSLFLSSAKLEDDAGTAAPGDGDLAELEKQLVGLRAAYRVFTTNVTIRGAKWSKSQKN